MSTQVHDKLFPVYVWEVPVRFWHWLMAMDLIVLSITGYLIGSPLDSVGGESSEHFLFGYIRFIHFAAGYIFAILFVLRTYWACVGNRFSREIYLVPLSMFKLKWWKGAYDTAIFYMTFRGQGPVYQGHNPLSQLAMFFMFLLGSLFMILSGFAMYGEAQGMESLTFMFFTSWFMPLVGYSQNAHTLHHLCMWYVLTFSLIHVYLVLREDTYSNETMVDTMFNGWRSSKK